MESSDHSSTSNESNSFFAVGTIVESMPKDPIPEKEGFSREVYNPIYLVLILYFFIPLFLIFNAMATTSFFGLAFLLIMIIHLFLVNQVNQSYTGILAFLYFEIVFSLILFIVAIVVGSDPDMSTSSQLIGTSFYNSITQNPSFAVFSTFISICFESVPVSLFSHSPINLFNKCRIKVFKNKIVAYIIDILHSFSLAFLFSTNSSYLWYPILIYYIYSNISLIFIGRIKFWIFGKWIMTIYTLFYALFQFYMNSFIGEYWNPSKALSYQYIAPVNAKAANIVFSCFLVFTSTTAMTEPGWKMGDTKQIPTVLKKYSIVFITFLNFFILMFAISFPNYCTLYWIIIVFVCSYSNSKAAKKLFFPFLGFVFSTSFFALVITQFDVMPHPNDDGRDLPFSFMKLFGLFKYLDSNFRYLFCLIGFIFIAIFGQIGRINHIKQPLTQHLNKFDKMENPSDVTVAKKIKKMERFLVWKSILRHIKIIFLDICHFIYSICVYLSLTAVSVISLTCSIFHGVYTFQFISCLYEIIILLSLYYRWTFQILRFICGLLILISAFYKSSDNYDCRKSDNCLFFGYSQLFEDFGLIPPPEISLLSFIWPILAIFILSTFLVYEKRSLNIYYSSYLIFALYSIIVIMCFCYAFIFELSLFSLIYLFIGSVIFATLAFHWQTLRTLVIMLCFIVISIQLALYSITQSEILQQFFDSHIGKNIIEIQTRSNLVGETILLSFLFFFCSIVFRGNQSLDLKEYTIHIVYEIRKKIYTFYFYISWVLVFGFSLSNQYPTFIKFCFLLLYSLGTSNPKTFCSLKYTMLLLFFILMIIHVVFHLFVIDIPSKSLITLRYIGCYFKNTDSLTILEKNTSFGWQVGFILVTIFSLQPNTYINHPSTFENHAFTKIYYGFCGMMHSWLPVITQTLLCVSTLYSTNIFGWITCIILVITVFAPSFFDRFSSIILGLLNIILLVQYLLYLGYPNYVFDSVPTFSIFDYFSKPMSQMLENVFKFIGIYDITRHTLVMSFISTFAIALYHQFKKKNIDYKKCYDDLPFFVKNVVNFITVNIFEITTMIIIVIISVLKSIDSFIFYISLSFFFVANLLFDFSHSLTNELIVSYLFIIIILRGISRLPLFIVDNKSIFVKRLFDLPINEQSQSTVEWVFIFVFHQLCKHIMKSKLYKVLKEKHIKHSAYRYIRERQLLIIEKLDQEILLKNRHEEINALNRKDNNLSLPESFNISESNSQMLSSDAKTVSENQKLTNQKWYARLYSSVIFPQIEKFIKIIAMTAPINDEPGLNVLTLESLTLLMKRCLGYYERNHEFHLEERERQFLISLPPSFSLQFSSLSHILNIPIYHDSYEIIFRYFLCLFYKLPTLLLTLFSVIYLFTKPYIFSLVIFIFVCFIFLSINYRGFPNTYRFFISLILIILGFRIISRIDIINEQFLIISDSLTNVQTRISTLSLIGFDPDNNILIEVLLFASAIFFIVDQINSMKIFPAKFYTEKLSSLLPGFPIEYCYGIMDDPIHNLGMNIPQNHGFLKTVKETMKKTWMRTTNHSNFILIIDIISLITLITCWPDWEKGTLIAPSTTVNGYYSVNILFVVILIIHIIFTIIAYFCCLGDHHFALLCVEFLWLAYEFSMIFFYIRSLNSSFLSSAKFYIFLRVIQHIIAAHKSFIGRKFVSYKYKEFESQWKKILFGNYFIRFCPFIFEIQSILQWIGRPTLVSLSDFCIIRDMELQLEIIICNQFKQKAKQKNKKKESTKSSKKKEKKHQRKKKYDGLDHDYNYFNNPKISNPEKNEQKVDTKRRICIGTCILIIFLLIIFIPLLFLLRNSGDIYSNRVLMAKLEIGFGSFPPFYESYATIHEIYNFEHQELATSIHPSVVELAAQTSNSLYIITFPLVSSTQFQLSFAGSMSASDSLSDSSSNIAPYLKLDFSFERPTTSGNLRDPIFLKAGRSLNTEEKNKLSSVLNRESDTMDGIITLPRFIYVTMDTYVQNIQEIESNFNFIFNQGHWSLDVLPNSNLDISFMENTTGYSLLVFSQAVVDDLTYAVNDSANGSFIGVYLLVIIILGIIIRECVVQQIDSLWRKKLDNPYSLYKKIIEINLFRNAGDLENEKEKTQKFLEKIRSYESAVEETTETSS